MACEVSEAPSKLRWMRGGLGLPIALEGVIDGTKPIPIRCPWLSIHRVHNNLIENAVRYRSRVGVMVSRT